MPTPDFDWRLYLADGTTFDSNDGEPWESPIRPRVVCIAQPCAGERYENIIVNGTHYIFRTDVGCWMRHDSDSDVVDELQEHAPDIVACRKGKYVRRDVFKALWKQARLDSGIEHIEKVT